jgi:8-amino-7-oxononanoate synthase
VTPFADALNDALSDLREHGLYRVLRQVDSPQQPQIEIAGQRLLNFSSNDYLGLANDPRLKEAAQQALARYGVGAGASRLICGSLAPHHELEQTLAAFKGTEAALVFSSGYAAALGALGAVVGKGDILILDRLVHASIVDGARLCGAQLRVFRHNNLADLEKILKWANQRGAAASGTQRRPRVLVITESVFSMDGDLAPLAEIVELKDQHGAWLMVDEAHATGLFGPRRRGLAEAAGVSDRIEVQMGTLGKALGVSGGFICGSRALIDLLINRARSFIFSTAPPPALAAAAAAAVRLVQSEAGQARCAALWERVDQLKRALPARPWTIGPVQSPIVPLIVGPEVQAMAIAAHLRERGMFVPAVRYPAVARHQARLRLTVSAAHTSADLTALLAALAAVPAVDLEPRIPNPEPGA